MGTPLNPTPDAQVLLLLGSLTQRQLDICVMHFVDGRAEATIADWLAMNLKSIKREIAAAIAKVPQLKPLRRQMRQRPRKPRVVHLSQIDNPRDREREPFNADEL